jgi:amidohydrolase
MKGIGTHGAHPESGKDPIMMAAEFIVDVQTVVSRSIAAQSPAIITVGSIHGGNKRNIISEEVKMELTTRAFSEETRQQIIDGVKRTARGIAIAGGMTEDRMPIVTVRDDESTPAMYNDPALAARLTALFQQKLGKENVLERQPIMGSEDFGIFSLEHKIPAVIFWLGAYDPAKVAESQKSGVALPFPHSPLFAPLPEPALLTGVTAMSDAAISLLQ